VRWTLYHRLKTFLYEEEKQKNAIVRIFRFTKIQFCGSFLKGSHLQTCHRIRLARKWTIFLFHLFSLQLFRRTVHGVKRMDSHPHLPYCKYGLSLLPFATAVLECLTNVFHLLLIIKTSRVHKMEAFVCGSLVTPGKSHRIAHLGHIKE